MLTTQEEFEKKKSGLPASPRLIFFLINFISFILGTILEKKIGYQYNLEFCLNFFVFKKLVPV